MKHIVIAIFTALVAFTGAAWAAGAAATSDPNLWELIGPVIDAFRGGQHWYAGALALVAMVALAKHYGPKRLPWLGTSAGSAVLVLLGAFGATLAANLSGGAVITFAMASLALKTAVTAAGGYSLVRTLIIKPLAPLVAKGPKWLRVGFSLFSWMFSSPTKEAAEKAGQEAVDKSPATGVVGIVGDPHDVP